MATETTPTYTETKPARGFPGLSCIKCGSNENVIKLDLDDGDTLTCTGCEEDYSIEEVREHCTAWQHAIARIDRMFAE